VIPGVPGSPLPLTRGAGGFLLTHLALWFHEVIEPLDGKVLDDWGWASRPIRGSTTISNHASGTAVDLNATRHPMGVPTLDTFTAEQVAKIHRRLGFYGNAIRWGGDYHNRPDAMHFELDKDRAAVHRLVRLIRVTPRGHRVRAANPVMKG